MKVSINTINSLPRDVFLHAIEFLDDVQAIGRLAKVSSFLDKILNNGYFWTKLSSREGISLVEGKERNVRRDFRVLYPMRTGGVRPQDIGAIFGRVVSLPKMSPVVFDKIVASPEIRRGFVIVNFPKEVEISVGPERPFILDEQGRLQRATGPIEAGVIVCSLSMHNMRVLFPSGFDPDSWSAAFEQCNDSPEAGCFVMSKEVPDDTRDESWEEQKALLERRGYVATPLEVRTLFDLIRDRCLESQVHQRNFIRTSQTAKTIDGRRWLLVVGDFAPGIGLSVERSYYDSYHVGVAPCVSAEVPPAFGRVSASKGKSLIRPVSPPGTLKEKGK